MWKELLDNCEAVIFDLDGTLVDSMWVWRQIDIDYFALKNIDFPDNYQDMIEGMSVYETACYTKETFGIEDGIDVMIDTWNKMAFDQYSNHIPMKNGAYDFISYLNGHGIKLGIATSNSKELCIEALRTHGVLEFFDAIITGEECTAGKPAPDVYLMAANKLGVKAEKCIIFEDLCNGIKAGSNAGMITVAVKDEYSRCNWDEKIELADYYIEDYKEILNEIRNS